MQLIYVIVMIRKFGKKNERVKKLMKNDKKKVWMEN